MPELPDHVEVRSFLVDQDIVPPMRNIYFDLTEELNAEGAIAALASGQAVVFYQLALMSKDGDWILRETPEACRRALAVLEKHGARYRPGAPLDVRWLGGGWSSHFELSDHQARRVRCDFFSRPPQQEDRARLDARCLRQLRPRSHASPRRPRRSDLGAFSLQAAFGLSRRNSWPVGER